MVSMTRNGAGGGDAPMPLNAPGPSTFYGGDARGYVGFPTLAGVGVA